MLHQIELKVMTPVHVGMGMEKRLLRGLDYYFDNKSKSYFVIDQKAVLENLDGHNLERVSRMLSIGDFNGFEQYLRDAVKKSQKFLRYEWATNSGTAHEIRMIFQDGLGKYFIPGSSIKGSIRSILLKKLWNGNNNLDERALMGSIDNNLMRFLQITDCYVNQNPGIYPVKVFAANIHNNGFGMWKNRSREGHVRSFDAQQFITYYEMFSDGVNSNETFGDFRINWGLNKEIRKMRESTPNLKLFETEDISSLMKWVREHTDAFLEREIEFFKKYENDELTADFFDEIEWLKEENLADNNSCILRLGANVGWHSITGDWKYAKNINSHVDSVRERWNMVSGGRQNATKTRKIGFDLGENDDKRLFLPGFVKLTLK